ncbi:winged helix-turn-helix domain-containing protein [Haloarchaeobius sp. DFWS5]|uniref:winged helix-turn-helix domain-containing protein n=1 Tax=Haloarchaeobius sp. DFWS5 TaxID=3446114 RepID=UPI003EB810FC
MTAAESTSDLSHGEAFALLGNETRVAILRELWEAMGDGPLTFSELRERVGMRDSGQFNYHLHKLTDHFVRKVDDDGYTLRFAGAAVVGAILSGAIDRASFDDPVPTDGACPDCGGTLQLTYVDERATLGCADCAYHGSGASVPSGVFADREREQAPAIFDGWLRAQVSVVAEGFCMACTGPTTARVQVGDIDHTGYEEEEPLVVYECGRCNERVLSSVPEALLRDPAVVAFHHEHGVDLRTEPSWALPWLLGEVTVVSADPLLVSVDVTIGDETLRLTVDGKVTVVEEERVSA